MFGSKMKTPLLSPELNCDPSSFPPSLITYLYSGQFLAQWGARMWEFSVGLYVISIWPESLLLAAIYGVVESSSTALFGPIIRQLVDKLTLLKVLQLWLLTQSLLFIVAVATAMALLSYPNLKSTNSTAFISLILIINVSGAVGVLSLLAGTILIERERVVMISEGQPPGLLTRMNSVVRRIDLICKLFAPIVSGFIISFVLLRASSVAFDLLRTISVWFEYWLLASVYSGIPCLSKSSHGLCGKDQSTSAESSQQENFAEKISKALIVGAWKVYLEQEVLLQWGFTSLTVLHSPELQNTDDCYTRMGRHTSICHRDCPWNKRKDRDCCNTCLPDAAVSYFNSPNQALVHLVPVELPPPMCCLDLGRKQPFVGLHGDGRCGCISARAVDVRSSRHSADAGVQNSLQSTRYLMAYAMGLLISNPEDFWTLMMLSRFLLLLCQLHCILSIHVYRIRRHLIHWDKIFFWLIDS